MSWAVGYDNKWKRDIGYGVPAFCDHAGCGEIIDRGLAHVCGGEPYGGETGCGLYFCGKHHTQGEKSNLCCRCMDGRNPFKATKDHADWIKHKLTDPSWKAWRLENPEACAALSNIRR